MFTHLHLASLTVLGLFISQVFSLNSTSGHGLNREKHSRQYSTSYSNYGSPSLYTSPIEAIVVGVLAVCGLSLFGLPLIMMLFHQFSNNPGVSLIPTATTSVNTGRRKRNAENNLVDPRLFSQVVDSLQTFLQSEEKMQLLQRLIS